MNEDLQKELISILRELKNGAGPAWQALVEQRGGYYLMLALGLFALACIGALLSWRLTAAAKAGFAANKDLPLYEKSDFPSAYVGMAIVSAVAAGGMLVGAFFNLAAGMYPLGQLLGKVIG